MYTGIKVHVSDSQKKKLESSTTEIILAFSYEDLNKTGNDTLYVTKTQLNKIEKAINANKGVRLNISKAQLKYNIKNGGFLGTLAGLAARFLPLIASKVLPALGIGALTGAVSTGVSKLLGNGLYFKKGGCVCSIEKLDGDGLILRPYRGNHNFTKTGVYDGNGLYLQGKQGSGILGDIF